jgi:hypothetical protein
MPLLIGIIGQKGVGKSSVSSYIQTKYNATVLSLANPVKKIATVFGFSHESLYGTQFEKEAISHTGISGREFMQKFGTEFGREIFPKLFPKFNLNYGNNIWIQLLDSELMSNIENHTSSVYVVDDIRFPDEVDYIIKKKGVLIKIIRPGLYKDNHKSEINSNLHSNYIINNNNTKDELFKAIDAILVYHLKVQNH